MKKNAGKLILIILPIIFAIVLLYPTYQKNQIDEAKKEFLQKADKAVNATDSLEVMDEFKSEYDTDYEKAKEKALKLGLDLQGGMYVTLEVDVVKLIAESAQKESIEEDDIFLEVIEKTKEDVKESEEPALDIFMKNFNAIARPKGKSLFSYFDVKDLRDPSEEKILEDLQENAAGAIDQAREVISQRIDKYGVSEPNIQKQGARRILLELPGVKDETEIRKLLQTTARLEFNLLRNNEKIVRAFKKIDDFLAKQYMRKIVRNEAQEKLQDTAITEQTEELEDISISETLTPDDTSAAIDTLAAGLDTAAAATLPDTSNPYEGMDEEEIYKQYAIDHQFTRLFFTHYAPTAEENMQLIDYSREMPNGIYSFMIVDDSIEKFNAYLSRPEIKSFIPFMLKILLSAKPDSRIEKRESRRIYSIFSLKKEPELTGDVVTDARATFDPTTNQPMVLMGMNSDGAERWARITGENMKKRIAIILDDRVYSAPTVQAKITGGSSQITGMADIQEARLLEIVLKAGALEAPVRIIEERLVGPSLGKDSINAGLTASAIAFSLVILFMAFYYLKGGLIANFAVILNVTLVLSILAAFGGTLTLPGIAGIILTVGMAVDANVLIFERIREELFKGRSLRSAIDEGFSKALSAILDSNITTFITGLILFYFGSGPIQGFAMTLMIGILGTLFTGILVSRAIIEIAVSKGTDTFSFGQPKIVKN